MSLLHKLLPLVSASGIASSAFAKDFYNVLTGQDTLEQWARKRLEMKGSKNIAAGGMMFNRRISDQQFW